MALKFNPKHRPGFVLPEPPVHIDWAAGYKQMYQEMRENAARLNDGQSRTWMVSWGDPIKPRTRIQHLRGRVSDAWAVLTGAKRAMSDKDLADLMDY